VKESKRHPGRSAKQEEKAGAKLEVIPSELIEQKIFIMRGHKVMLDRDLAILYEVETRRLNEQVRRNLRRFPEDFMFQLNETEVEIMVSQNAIPSRQHLGGRLPLAFTEQGVAMLSSVLNSERAIDVNIQIIRTFTKLRALMANHDDLRRQIEEMEKKYDEQFLVVFEAIKQLIEPPDEQPKKIGFRLDGQTRNVAPRSEKK
jgi:hypothetical protein